MTLGALYDLAFGLAILVASSPAAALLRIDLPADTIYLRLNGVFLLLVAALYALPAARPERFHPIAPISAGGRLLGFIVLVIAWRGGSPRAFLLLAAADLGLGIVTALAWSA